MAEARLHLYGLQATWPMLAELACLGLERQGRHHDIVERRKALRDLHPSLYAAYMRTR